jgi:hypothetical protein
MNSAAARREAAGDGGTVGRLLLVESAGAAAAAIDGAFADPTLPALRSESGAEDGADVAALVGANDVRGADDGAGAAGGVGRSAAATQGSERRGRTPRD